VNQSEIVDLLAHIQAFDRRTVGETDVMAWHAVMRDIEFVDAVAAVVVYFTENTEWLMPAKLRELAIKARNSRLRRPEVFMPGCYEPDPVMRQRLVDDDGRPRALPAPADEPGAQSLPPPAVDDPDVAAQQHAAVRAAAARERTERGPDRGTAKVAGPWWTDARRREEHATELLANMGRLHIDESPEDPTT